MIPIIQIFILPLLLTLGLTAVYVFLSRSIRPSTQDSSNSLKMQSCTNTNNSYPPIGDVLAGLDGDQSADMSGYMGDTSEES